MAKRIKIPKALVLFFILVLSLGFTWPWEEVDNEEKKAPPQKTTHSFKKDTPLSSLQKSEFKRQQTQVRAKGDFEKIETQIQDLMRAHRNLKVDSGRQINQIRRIGEQTEIHKRILEDMQIARGGAPAYTPNDITELLRQEKIRLIQEQARKNQALLEQMNRRRNLDQSKRLTQEFERVQAVEQHQKAVEDSQRGSQLVGRS